MSQSASASSRRPPAPGGSADDVAVAPDLATDLVPGGVRVVQELDVPTPDGTEVQPTSGARRLRPTPRKR